MQRNCRILYGTRIAKISMYHSNGVFQVKLNHKHTLFSGLNLLNKRNELISKCRHENKNYLSNCKSVPPQQDAKLDDFLLKVLDVFKRHCHLTLNEKLSNQLSSMSQVESGYPQLLALFVNIILCRKYSTGLLNVYRVLYRMSFRLKIARSVKLVVAT